MENMATDAVALQLELNADAEPKGVFRICRASAPLAVE
jgi:hypothetical protein